MILNKNKIDERIDMRGIEEMTVRPFSNLSKAIQEQCLYEFRRQIEYKSLWNNIKVIL